jgi:hypothetical protein
MDLANTIRAESVERAALADLHLAATADLRQRLGLDLCEIGEALVSLARHHPTILINRAIGLGLTTPAVRETVDTIVTRYRDEGIGRYFLQLDPAARPAELPKWLRESGLQPYRRAWAKFSRGTEAAPRNSSDLEVREIGAEHAVDFARIAVAGFDLDDDWIPVLAGLVGRKGWHIYLSFDGDTPAGCGAMRIHEGLAWFDWAATLPEFRRRGSQGAVLTRRLSDGLRLGCEGFLTSTGEAVKGDPQHSYRNIERYGFRRTHARANWVPTD